MLPGGSALPGSVRSNCPPLHADGNGPLSIAARPKCRNLPILPVLPAKSALPGSIRPNCPPLHADGNGPLSIADRPKRRNLFAPPCGPDAPPLRRGTLTTGSRSAAPYSSLSGNVQKPQRTKPRYRSAACCQHPTACCHFLALRSQHPTACCHFLAACSHSPCLAKPSPRRAQPSPRRAQPTPRRAQPTPRRETAFSAQAQRSRHKKSDSGGYGYAEIAYFYSGAAPADHRGRYADRFPAYSFIL